MGLGLVIIRMCIIKIFNNRQLGHILVLNGVS